MRVPVKIICFSCFLFSVTFVQGQECLRGDITYENIERVAKPSYDDDETVEVNCVTGYVGFYRLKCKNGQWQTFIARSCSKKKCGHPGETANGDFKLIEGRDYTYGATVEYTCKKGYEMATRINRRHCRMKGWDNSIPICEEVRCPVIRTDGDVTASGNTREGTYGDVIHFECVSSEKKLDGSSVIHCMENGVWSGPVPQCIVTCNLDVTESGAVRTIPEGKTIFKAGETVGIFCSAKNPFFHNQEKFTCTNNGKWDYKPTCEEIRCQVPQNQHVFIPMFYFSGDLNLNVKKPYSCKSGYRKMAAEATCTRDGWTPKPLCADVTCAAPNIPNAEILGDQRTIYNINSTIQYKCNPGFEPEQPVQITCTSQNQWTGIQECTEKQKTCRDLSVENGLIYSNTSNKEEILYICNTGYKPFSGNWWDSATCIEGSWSDETRCIPEEECGAFPRVHHGKLKQTKETFQDGDTIEFECDPGFIATPHFITCVNGTWEKPVCEVGVHCDIPPKVENAFITSKPEELYVDGSRVTYICQRSFLMNGENTVFCRNGIWEETPTCEEVKCVAKLPVNMRSDATEDGPLGTEVSIRPGHTIILSCVGRRTKLQGERKITCLSSGEWNVPFPKCVGEKCERPPPVEFADTTEMTKSEYNSREKVEYICFNKYTLDLSPPYSKYLTCEQGEWRGNIKCLKPCSVTVEEMDDRGIQLRYRGREKIFSPHLDRITFACLWGKRLIGSDSNLIQYCNDGVMDLPVCV
ncbi:complement factor H-like isoform X1 [Pimephales promelas]|uniref:complement factor H-like isoform X1 n=1 Tax=Pimephales promelas TaxID=90988 RepID=UPI001955C6DB|nr:complement factor H-like isoform X1 [Pimephales promelas]